MEHYTIEDKNYTLTLFENKCFNCNSSDEICIDHHYPLSLGYALTRENAVALCRACNSSKGAKLPSTFYSAIKLEALHNKLYHRR